MKKVFYYSLLLFLILSIPVLLFGIVNSMASLKYETENVNDCISLTSGQNLCRTIKIIEGLIVMCIGGLIALVALRESIVKQ